MKTDETTDEGEDAPASEDLRWMYAGGDSDEVPARFNTRDMRRRLPGLIHTSFAYAWQIDRRSTAWLVGCQVLSGLLSALGLFVTTRALATVIRSVSHPADIIQALPSIVVLAAAAGLRALLGVAIQALTQHLSPRIARELGRRVLETGTRTEMAAYDKPGFTDRYDMAERGVDSAERVLGQAQNFVSSLATLIAASVVIGALYLPLVGLLLLVAIPQAVTALKGARIAYVSNVATFRDRRVLYLLRWFLVSKDQADQVRTDTIAPFMLRKYDAAGARVDRTTDQAAKQTAKVNLLGAAATGLASGLLWTVVFLLLVNGQISAAVAGTCIFSLRSAAQGLQGIIGFGSDVLRSGFYLEDIERFITEAEVQRIEQVRGTLVPAAPGCIRLEGVSFAYPDSDSPTLRSIDFQVGRGEIVAVIGTNGSGKTTLMKLLCGLNLPTAGRVTWDGVNVAEFDADALWEQCSVVPQEFARWPLTCRENITLGQPHPDGDAAVHRAAAASGADDVIDSLRSGLDTLLAREVWGGVALSSGQWQRLAVARALHRDAGLLVMDEPTSDLDPSAEHRIFTGLRELAAGRAVVLVTHNLANTAVADRIVCLENGRIIQEGTFEELLKDTGGLFHRLWELSNDRLPAPRKPAE